MYSVTAYRPYTARIASNVRLLHGSSEAELQTDQDPDGYRVELLEMHA
jgi:hypothetical protein